MRYLLALSLLVLAFPATAGASLPRSLADRPDDYKGEQIHLVYVIPSDGQDRALDTNGTIENSVAGFQEWLDGQTRGRVLRVDTSGTAPDITFFKLSKTDDEMARLNPGIVTEIELQLDRAGITRKGKIYAVYYDGTSPDRCGGAAWPPTVPGRTAAVYLRGKPCDPDPAASYWQFAMFHDVFHVAGFVPTCAPNHTLAGHVSDDPADLMYAGAQPWKPSVLDTGRDDYYEHSAGGCPDFADSPYLSPRLPTANLTPNPSFERHALGWGTRNGTLERVAAADAPHGSYAVKASPSSAGVVFVGDCPVGIGCSVASTTNGATYVGAGYVRAASPSAVGKLAVISLAEFTQGGTLVRMTSQSTLLTTQFKRLAVAAEAVAPGNVLGISIHQRGAAPTDAWLADLITITPATDVMRVLGTPNPGAPATWNVLGADTKRASSAPLATSEPVDLARFTVMLDGGGAAGTAGQPLRGAVFANANGAPGALLGRTEQVTIAPGQPAGLVKLAFDPPLRIAPGTYWLGLHGGGAAAVARYRSTGGVGGLRSNSDVYADGTRNPFGPSVSGTATVPIVATGAP